MKVVYLIRAAIHSDDVRVKIGISENLDKRYSSIKCHSPVAVDVLHTIPIVSGKGLKLESGLHSTFKCFHVHGEWFDIPEEVLSYFIQNVKSQDDGINYIENIFENKFLISTDPLPKFDFVQFDFRLMRVRTYEETVEEVFKGLPQDDFR